MKVFLFCMVVIMIGAPHPQAQTAGHPAAIEARQLSKKQRHEMLDCALLRNGGPWVDAELFRDGRLRFSYVFKHQDPNGSLITPFLRGMPFMLEVAFWDSTRTRGHLIEFEVGDKTADRRDEISIINDGWIRKRDGQLDIVDNWGGIYTHERLQNFVLGLRRLPLTIVDIHKLRKTSAVCFAEGDSR